MKSAFASRVRSFSDWPRLRAEARVALREFVAFWRYMIRRFIDDECLQSAATLAYTTLLSLVPLFAVSFALFTAFPVFEDMNERVQEFLISNLVPASGEVVQDYIQQFAGRAAGLTLAGLIGISVTAILMMAAIDRTLNRIWRVTRRRRPLQSFMVYWAVITVGPVLVAVSLAASSYVTVLAEYTDALDAGQLQTWALEAAPVVAIILAFGFLYSAVPNRRISLWHAAAGAAFAALLFEFAKRGFALFVTNFPTYEAIYGALATLPILLVWIYLSWVIVLLGAEFTQALSGFRLGRAGTFTDPRLALVLAVRLTGDFWQAQQQGRVLRREDILRLEPEAGETAIGQALEALEHAQVIRRTDDGAWVLVRDPSSYTVLDLYRDHPFVLGTLPASIADLDHWNEELAGMMAEAMDGVEHALSRPVKEIFRRPEGQESRAGSVDPPQAPPYPVADTRKAGGDS
ncbi:MAG: virulence factor BrkB family protein [Ectothiorhodospiraceae bacterium]|nr:virulence factor BrkB family protein [Ectothiorhodospiraceae bacterium]